MRSAPGVWYTGGYYEKIYCLYLRNVSKASALELSL